MTLDIISTVFGPLYGKPCWNVKPGYGSFMTLEFGEPHLGIRDPLPPTEGVSELRNRRRAKRHIYVKGDWHLWIYCCEWQVFTGGELVGDSDLQGSTKDRIELAASELDGQKLLHVTINPAQGTSVFEFDLGSRLETQPYDNSEQWLLYEPSGDVFTYRADGKYSHQPGNTQPEQTHWLSFQP